MSIEPDTNKDLSHHKQFNYCTNRLKYRDGKRLTAVKVYTFVNESRHLLLFGVPKINLFQEVKQLFKKYGTIEFIHLVTKEVVTNPTVEVEQFTDCYHIAFDKINCARRAKHFLDRKSFYGGILHISYAPEYENVTDVKNKILARQNDVQFRMKIEMSKSKLDNGEPSKKKMKRN